MMLKKIQLFLGLSVASAVVAANLNLRGFVVESNLPYGSVIPSASTPISSAKITLQSTGNIVYTNVIGAFTMIDLTPISEVPSGLNWTNGLLYITLPASANLQITAVSLNGNATELFRGQLSAGSQQFDLNAYFAQLPLGQYQLRVSLNGIDTWFRAQNTPMQFAKITQSPVQSLAGIDTLTVSKFGYQMLKIPLASNDMDLGVIPLAPNSSHTVVSSSSTAISSSAIVSSSSTVISSVAWDGKPVRLVYMDGDGSAEVDRIEWKNYTHVALFSAFVPQDDGSIYRYKTYGNIPLTVPFDSTSYFMKLHKSTLKAAGLKTLFVLGGAGDPVTTALRAACTSSVKRQNMVQQLGELINGNLLQPDGKTYIKSAGFDGLDVDWEFPVTAKDKQCFFTLLTELRAVLPGKLLTVATSYSTAYYEAPTAVPAVTVNNFLTSGVDWIGLMTYDYSQSASQLDHSGYGDGVKWLNFWRAKGIPASKLVFGLATYGYTVPGVNGQTSKQTLAWSNYYNNATYAPYFSSKDSTLMKATYVADNLYRGVMYWKAAFDAHGTASSYSTWVNDYFVSRGL